MCTGPIPEEPEMPDGLWVEAWDDVNGGYLDPVEVKKARATEINWVREQKIYEIVPRQTCYNETGKAPLLLWIDTNKGDDKNSNYRSRIVAREIKARKKISERLSRNSFSPPCHR